MKIFVSDKKFYSTLVRIALPICLQTLISFSVNMMDTIMLGSFGEVVLSGAALANSFYAIFNVICLGLGGGAAVITSQYWGKGETEPIKQMTSILLKIAFCVSLLFAALTMFLPNQIMTIYSKEADVIAQGARYLRILSVALLFNGLTIVTTNVLRSVGIVRLPLVTTIISFFINVFFNYMFIFGKFGAPRLEIAGAAIGTVIARAFEVSMILGYLLFKDKRIGFRAGDLKTFDKGMLKTYYKTGLPVLLSDFIMIFGMNITTIIIGHVGSAFVAANSITSSIGQVVSIISASMASAASVITGNTVGQGENEKAYNQGITFIAISVILGIMGAGIILLVSEPFFTLFSVEEGTLLYARQIIKVLAAIFLFNMLDGLLTKGVLRGGGDTKFLIFGDTVFTWIASIPLGLLTAFVLKSPIWLIFLSLQSDKILKAVLCFWRFFSKRWIRNITAIEQTASEAV